MKRFSFTVAFNTSEKDPVKLAAFVKKAVEDCCWQLGAGEIKETMKTTVQPLNLLRGNRHEHRSEKRTITDNASDYIGTQEGRGQSQEKQLQPRTR